MEAQTPVGRDVVSANGLSVLLHHLHHLQEDEHVQQPPDGAVHQAGGWGQGQLLGGGVQEEKPGGGARLVKQREAGVDTVHVGGAI